MSDGGSPRVIVYGYDGLPIQPVAPPSPDYIPDPEEPQIPPVPLDDDEREPMFMQPHDLDYVPEPIYVLPIKEQPLPPVDSPTAESPGYRMVRLTIPMDGGDDGDDDDGDSSGDDADEDEDDEDEEEEEHLAPADSTIVTPVDEPVFPPEGTEPV
ncbi:hypothetical protein Tco_0338713, partial [Tanacetum coccineum]